MPVRSLPQNRVVFGNLGPPSHFVSHPPDFVSRYFGLAFENKKAQILLGLRIGNSCGIPQQFFFLHFACRSKGTSKPPLNRRLLQFVDCSQEFQGCVTGCSQPVSGRIPLGHPLVPFPALRDDKIICCCFLNPARLLGGITSIILGQKPQILGPGHSLVFFWPPIPRPAVAVRTNTQYTTYCFSEQARVNQPPVAE